MSLNVQIQNVLAEYCVTGLQQNVNLDIGTYGLEYQALMENLITFEMRSKERCLDLQEQLYSIRL